MMSMLLLVTTPMRCDAMRFHANVGLLLLFFLAFLPSRQRERIGESFFLSFSFFFFFFFFFLNETNDYQEDAALRVQCA
jgi:hypothetical protein